MIRQRINREALVNAYKLVLVASLTFFGTNLQAQSVAREAGKVVGEFGAGVGEAAMDPMRQSLETMQPQWITIPPRSKEECMAESGGVVNPIFMRCRNGWQEHVRYDRAGNKKVLSERAIPLR